MHRQGRRTGGPGRLGRRRGRGLRVGLTFGALTLLGLAGLALATTPPRMAVAELAFAGTGGRDTLRGNAGRNDIFGGPSADRLDGGEGNDSIHAGSGDDEVLGGPGADTLRAEQGRDRVFGAEGDDDISGGPGDDVLYGGDGDDLAVGNSGDDHLSGRNGNDIVAGGSAATGSAVTPVRTGFAEARLPIDWTVTRATTGSPAGPGPTC